jgi:hypothetical protein
MKQLLKSVIARMGGNHRIGKKIKLGLVGGLSLSLVLAVSIGSARPSGLQQENPCLMLQPCLLQPLQNIGAALEDMYGLLSTLATGSRRVITFDNNTGVAVFDIHIEFDQAVTIEDGGDFEEYENDGSLKIKVRGSGNARPKVKKWYWTDKNHRRVGDVHNGDPGT